MSVHARKRNVSQLFGGLLILLGVLFLLDQLVDFQIGRLVWPLFIVVPGILLFVLALALPESGGQPMAIISSMITMTGLVLIYQNISGHWASWAYLWALIAPTSAGLGQILYGSLKGQQEIVRSGKQLARVGLIIFTASAIFFELFVGLSGFGLGRLAWSILLIAVGLWLLLRNLLAGLRN